MSMSRLQRVKLSRTKTTLPVKVEDSAAESRLTYSESTKAHPIGKSAILQRLMRENVQMRKNLSANREAISKLLVMVGESNKIESFPPMDNVREFASVFKNRPRPQKSQTLTMRETKFLLKRKDELGTFSLNQNSQVSLSKPSFRSSSNGPTSPLTERKTIEADNLFNMTFRPVVQESPKFARMTEGEQPREELSAHPKANRILFPHTEIKQRENSSRMNSHQRSTSMGTGRRHPRIAKSPKLLHLFQNPE
eukprot:TRINITY_DN14496_c0_g1_i1.p1 TRINITY_DN14496_c0_g1~~TRINITY_DN14496_c0_g1_i1.p1  ORF type:complete len:251 (+),score=31.31 TRINITY_DN14496_c0_g1_i1:115-867(+)